MVRPVFNLQLRCTAAAVLAFSICLFQPHKAGEAEINEVVAKMESDVLELAREVESLY